MCGIAGIIQADPFSFSKEQLKQMTGSLIHRGPDGENLWQNPVGNVLLGHRRLSVIDLSEAASQPLHLLDRYTIIHNGEIYNYIELKEYLQKKGYSFRTNSDTEVILAAYDHYYDECIEHFDGMFAFAIWDEEEQELFAARDRFGEKPFYYSINEKGFVFASEMKALWAAGIERKPNLQMLFNFITIGYTDNPQRPEETFFENIFKLPAASRLYYTPSTKELTIEKYWDIDLSVQHKLIADNEAADQFRHLFSVSVKRRLRSDVSIGTSLSGGLDSSSVVAEAVSLLTHNSPLTSFTAIFPGFEKDESAFASRIAGDFNLQQQTVEISVNDFLNDWEKFLYYQEEPFGSASAYAQYKVYELAKQYNVKVLLDGQGADETLAGYNKYYKWFWQELFQNRKLGGSKELKAASALGIQEKFTYKNVIAALFPDIASVILERQYLANAVRQEDLTRDFIRLQSKEAYYSTPATFSLNGALYFNTCVHGLEELLRLADRNSMAHGREVRLPFLNHDLVEFIFSLPAHLKIRNGWTKWLLRQSMKDRLPQDIVWRKDKVGFEPPQKEWMKDTRVQDMIHEARRKLVNEKILKPGVLTKPASASSSHEADTYDWRYLASAFYL
ncbi:MAG: asparagine synthase (glutamine-hydrolyzing) [Chitinophagaceae bacterium]|nr:asparagine synthase (glutamine-hydrolyzing) [Chitinophagaceae bacterium]